MANDHQVRLMRPSRSREPFPLVRLIGVRRRRDLTVLFVCEERVGG